MPRQGSPSIAPVNPHEAGPPSGRRRPQVASWPARPPPAASARYVSSRSRRMSSRRRRSAPMPHRSAVARLARAMRSRSGGWAVPERTASRLAMSRNWVPCAEPVRMPSSVGGAQELERRIGRAAQEGDEALGIARVGIGLRMEGGEHERHLAELVPRGVGVAHAGGEVVERLSPQGQPRVDRERDVDRGIVRSTRRSRRATAPPRRSRLAGAPPRERGRRGWRARPRGRAGTRRRSRSDSADAGGRPRASRGLRSARRRSLVPRRSGEVPGRTHAPPGWLLILEPAIVR